MKHHLVLAAILLASGGPALAQSTEPGTILLTLAAAPTPGAYEAHPAIILKDGSTCDLLSVMCIAHAEDEFGAEVYVKRDEVIRELVKMRRGKQ